MKRQEENTAAETSRIEKLKIEEAKLLAKEQARTQAYLAREREIEKAQKIKEDQRTRDRADEESRELAKEKVRKEAYQAKEKAISDDLEARRQKNKKID
ncbi:MAG: hypothetical protein PHU23_01410 [Dehalococcoidales bacterium]|nr:hypothetical protein [Dehalococcoidales bacterium]